MFLLLCILKNIGKQSFDHIVVNIVRSVVNIVHTVVNIVHTVVETFLCVEKNICQRRSEEYIATLAEKNSLVRAFLAFPILYFTRLFVPLQRIFKDFVKEKHQ